MDNSEERLRRLLNTACRIGDINDSRVCCMRAAVDTALQKLRCGKIDQARVALEEALSADDHRSRWITTIKNEAQT